MIEAQASRNEEVHEEVHTATMVQLHARTPEILTANLINGTFTALIFSGITPQPLLTAWLIIIVLMCVVRGLLWYRYRRLDLPFWNKRWSRIALVGSSTAGLIWGSAGLFFFTPYSPVHLAALVFVLGGMAAGALTTLSAHLPCLTAYLILSVFPFLLRLVMEGGKEYVVMAVMGSVFLISLMVIGRRTHAVLVQSFALRFENRTLVESLENRVANRTRRQAMVVDFSQRALSGMDTDDLLREATVTLALGLDTTYAVATEQPSSSAALVVRASTPRDDLMRDMARYSLDPGCPTAEAIRTGRPSVSANLRIDRFAVPVILRDRRILAIISVPIHAGHSPFGTLEAWFTAPRDHASDDIDFVRTIANTVATAIQRNSAEEDVQRLALHDPLTGLPNRTLFHDYLRQAITRSMRDGSLMALLLIDLDHFKDVNDTLGHSAGDQLLVEVGHRLRRDLRRADPPTRLGGDEFALILAGLDRPDEAAAVAEKVQDGLREPFVIGGHELHLGASIGITICPLDGKHPEDLLRNADLALYRAKDKGRGLYQFFSPEMARDVEDRIGLIRELRSAVADGALQLQYQPQFRLSDGRMSGVEALIRWSRAEKGIVLPEAFIPVAETCGLMSSLGDWTIRASCVQARQWRAEYGPPFTMAVNVSLAQWRREEPATAVSRALQLCGCDPHLLELEITEREFPLTSENRLLENLSQLRKEGVSIAIDDFGTGHSNLRRLRSLPVDRIKIDRSFVGGIGHDTDSEVIVKAIISLGRNLDVSVVAEGVEKEAQLDFLRAEGCACAQGFYLGRPMHPEAVGDLLRMSSRAALSHPLASDHV